MMPSDSEIDRLSALLERFRVRSHLFHAGPLCGETRFAAMPGRGFLHVMRRGEMSVTHSAGDGAPKHIEIREPSLLFYPRPLAHNFHNAPRDGADFACATLEFEGGEQHPLARALPALIVLPLARLEGLQHTLALLFAETEQVRCGQRHLANRLFEVLLLQLFRWLLAHPEEASLPTGLLMGLADPHIARALTVIHENPGAPWSVQSLAEHAGMSRSAFAVAFKARVGETPADYLAHWRLTIAQSELSSGTALKTIAHDLGYASASTLSRVFAQKVGVSPREWLRRQDTRIPSQD